MFGVEEYSDSFIDHIESKRPKISALRTSNYLSQGQLSFFHLQGMFILGERTNLVNSAKETTSREELRPELKRL